MTLPPSELLSVVSLLCLFKSRHAHFYIYFSPIESSSQTNRSIYEGVKNAWTWSRGLPVAGSVLGLYETAALTIVSKTTDGKDAASLDKEILHHITGLDKDVIDPAIAKLMAVIWPGVEKAEDILRCMPIVPLLFPMLKEDGEAEPEATPVNKPNPFKVATSIDVN